MAAGVASSAAVVVSADATLSTTGSATTFAATVTGDSSPSVDADAGASELERGTTGEVIVDDAPESVIGVIVPRAELVRMRARRPRRGTLFDVGGESLCARRTSANDLDGESIIDALRGDSGGVLLSLLSLLLVSLD